jgi:hypothetical protein
VLQAPLTIQNPNYQTAINIDDSSDTKAQSFVVGTNGYDANWGFVHEAASSAFSIDFRYGGTSSLRLNTGTASGNVVGVWHDGVPTTIWCNGPATTVNVGNGIDGAQDILATLNVENPNYPMTLNVGDTPDTRQVTQNINMGTFTPNGDTLWGFIRGLAPADIDYEVADMSSLSLTTGAVTNIVHVESTPVPTTVNAGTGTTLIDVSALANNLTVLLNPAQPGVLTTLVNALSNLPAPSQPVTVTVDGQGGTYSKPSATMPNNVSLQFVHCNFVSQVPFTSSIALSSDQGNSTTYGQTVTLSATVSAPGGGTPAGSVQFAVDGTNVGTAVALTNGGASLLLPVLLAGNHSLTATFTSTDSAIAGSTAAPLPLAVAPAPLTITVDNQSSVQGASLPALTFTSSGFVNGDTVASLTTAPTVSTTATAASAVGSYPITASGAVDPNYTINYVPGTLTITAGTPTPIPAPAPENPVQDTAVAVSPGAKKNAPSSHHGSAPHRGQRTPRHATSANRTGHAGHGA